MHRLRESLIWKYVAIYVAASMALPYAVVGFPASARAQAQPVVTSATCIVLPVLDPAGSDRSVESQKATDALAIALEDSREFTVTSKLDLERELTSLGLTTPLSEEEQVRLADRLAVEKVVSGQVVVLGVDGQTGECIARLQVQMLDAAMAEYLNGAQVLVKTKPMPGWTGEERNRVINKALREAAETAVWQMRATRVRVGAVTSVSDLGVAMIGLGAEDGVSTGLEMLVVRPTYQKDLDEIMMMKVGKLGVKDVQSDMSYARPLAGSRAKIGDKVYALYKPPVRMVAEARSRGLKKTGRLVTALGLFAGLLAVAGGDHTTGPPQGVRAHLYQQTPGDAAVIRIRVRDRWVPLTEQIHGWLFFRAEGVPNLLLSPQNLVGVVDEARLPGGNVWDDYATLQAGLAANFSFQYYDEVGDLQDGTVDIEYNHLALTPGATYYWRVRRVTDPEFRAGSGAPITAAQLRAKQVTLVTPTIDVDPPESLSEGSAPTNAVTYFSPPVLQSPDDGAQNQSTSSITFAWDATLGANEYLLQVFPEDDPDGLRNPVYQGPPQRQPTAGTMRWTIEANLAPNTRFYWRVGARRSGEAEPVVGLGNQTGWLFSQIRSFKTAIAPPPPPGTSAAGAGQSQPGQAVRHGFFNLPRYGHD